VPALGEHFMHGSSGEAALQRRIHARMTERHPRSSAETAPGVSMRSMLPRKAASVLRRAPVMRRFL